MAFLLNSFLKSSRAAVTLIILFFTAFPAFVGYSQNQETIFAREDLRFIQNLFKDEFFRFARQESAEFIKTYPKSPLIADVVFIQAQIDVVNKQYDRALVRYDKVIKEYPEVQIVEDALYYRGALKLQMNLNDGLNDFKILEKKFKKTKYRSRISFHRGEFAFKQKQWNKAEGYFNEVLNSEGITEKRRLENQHYLSWIHYFKGDTLLAKSMFFELLESDIPDLDKAKMAFQLAVEAQKQEKYKNAISWYERQMKEWPNNEFQDRSRFWVAECLYLIFKKTPEASSSEDKQKAIGLFSENLNLEKPVSLKISRYHRGWLLYELGKKSEAETDFSWLQENDTEYAADLEISATRAAYFEENSDLVSANKVYASALEYQKEPVVRNMLLINLIRHSHTLKDCSAILNWSEKTDLSPANKDTPEIAYYAGQCHYAKKDWKTAAQYYSLIPLETQYGKVIFDNYVKVYLSLEDYEGGITYLSKAEAVKGYGGKDKIGMMKIDLSLQLQQWTKALEFMVAAKARSPKRAKDIWFLLNIAKTADSGSNDYSDKTKPMHRFPVERKSYYDELALKHYQEAYNLVPATDKDTKLSLLDILATRYSNRGEHRKVVAFYRDGISIVEKQSQKDQLRMLIANILIKELNSQKEAQRELHKIHAKGNNPVNFEASSLLAELYVEQKKFVQAIKILEDLSKQPISSTQWHPLVHFRLGELYQSNERWKKAVHHYNQVVKSKQKSPLKPQAKSRAASINKYLEQKAQSQSQSQSG